MSPTNVSGNHILCDETRKKKTDCLYCKDRRSPVKVISEEERVQISAEQFYQGQSMHHGILFP